MAIEGPLRELALTDVFQLLDLSRKTGMLTVTSETGGRKARVRFDRGAIVTAELAGSTGRIDRLLLRAGKVTEAQVNEAVRRQRADPSRRIGAILVEMGAVSEADLKRQLRFQIEEIIFQLIQWKDGYFRFEEGSAGENGAVPIRVPTESLLMEAARRIDEWSTLEAKVPHMGLVPALTGDSDGGTLDLHPTEWEVLAEIDGSRSLKEIAGDLGRSEFDVAKIVFGLISTGVVDIVDEQPATPEPVVGDRSLFEGMAAAHAALRDSNPQRAIRLLGDLSRAHPDSPEVHVLTARSQAVLGRWTEAAQALDRVIALDPLSAVAHYHLGFAAARMGDFRRAEEAWTTYLRLFDGEARRSETAQRARAAVSALRAVLEEEVE
jgi:tetratricopeptide (TPR) repeat protein